MDIDIKDFYYDTPLEKFEYMQLPLKLIPQEIVEKYKLVDLAVNGNVFVEIRKGMPGLKHAGKIANDRLTTHLAKHGYRPVPRIPSLWKHDTNSITFTLVVDDFGVKYTDKGCRSSPPSTQKTIRHNLRLGRQKIPRRRPRLGLQE